MRTEDVYIDAVEKAMRSTVGVQTALVQPYPFVCHPMHGVGSGLILDEHGHVLTSWHVVREASGTVVALPDGRLTDCEVVGVDQETDMAVLEAETKDLVPAEFGDSDGLRLGQPVLAVGNPLGMAGGPTVTSGVISSLSRRIHWGHGCPGQLIQTDAPINPGNSGGPVIDLSGRVVGVAAAHIPHADGIGFAIPGNLARKVADEIIANGRVQRPWLGIVGVELDKRIARFYGLTSARGILITEVMDGGPAAAAGIRTGDVLRRMDGEELEAMEDLTTSLRGKKVKEPIEADVERTGKRRKVNVTLGTRPF